MSFSITLDSILENDRSGLLSAKNGWQRIKLKEVATIQNGYPFESAYFSKAEGTPLIRIRDIVPGETETYYKGSFDPNFLVHKGDLLIGMDGDFNCALWSGEAALLNQRVCRVIPDESKYLKKFLLYVLPGYLLAINQNTSSLTVKHLSSRTIGDIPLPCPPIEDQKSIVDKIEEQFTRLDAGITALKRIQANMKRYRASVLKAACEGRLVPTEAELAKKEGRSYETGAELLERILAERRKNWTGRGKYKEPTHTTNGLSLPLGWTWATVEQLSDKVQYGHTASAVTKNSGIRFLRITDIQNGKIDWSTVPTCNIEDSDIKELHLKSGDIVFARTGATVGKSFQLKDPFPASIFASYLIRVSPCSDIISNWLYAYFQSPDYWRQITEFSSGIGQPCVNGTKLQSLRMPLPPLAEQHRIVSEVERRLSVIDELESLVTANLKRADRLRQAILKKAFSGESTI